MFFLNKPSPSSSPDPTAPVVATETHAREGTGAHLEGMAGEPQAQLPTHHHGFHGAPVLAADSAPLQSPVPLCQDLHPALVRVAAAAQTQLQGIKTRMSINIIANFRGKTQQLGKQRSGSPQGLRLKSPSPETSGQLLAGQSMQFGSSSPTVDRNQSSQAPHLKVACTSCKRVTHSLQKFPPSGPFGPSAGGAFTQKNLRPLHAVSFLSPTWQR